MSPSERRAAEVGEVDVAAPTAGPSTARAVTTDSGTIDDAHEAGGGTGNGARRDRGGRRRPGATGDVANDAATADPDTGDLDAADPEMADPETADPETADPEKADAAEPDWLDDDEPFGPIEIPEIIPATIDPPPEPAPEPARRSQPRAAVVEQDPAPSVAVSSRHEAIEAWQTAASTPLVVPVPAAGGARVSTLRSVARRPRVRKVTRVVRHIDPWSTFKVSLLFSVVLYGVLLTAGVLLWNVASNTGTIDNVERWFTQFGWESYELKGGEIFHNAWIAGLFGVVGLTGLGVLTATLFNLISDMVGGVRVTVLEEEVIERTTSRSDRFVVRRPLDVSPPVAEFDVDGETDLPTNGAPVRAPGAAGAARPG